MAALEEIGKPCSTQTGADPIGDRVRWLICILQLHRAFGVLHRIRKRRGAAGEHHDKPRKDEPRTDDFEEIFGAAALARVETLECFVRDLGLDPDAVASRTPDRFAEVREKTRDRRIFATRLTDLFETYQFCCDLGDAVLRERASTRRSRLAEFNARFQQVEDDFALDALKRLCGDESLTDRMAILFFLDLKFAQRVASIMQMPVPFEMVLSREMDCIHTARYLRGLQEPYEDLQDPITTAREANLIGLALSGGGIRSATFNLGVLQALSEVHIGIGDEPAAGKTKRPPPRLLTLIDYLSTVSGGGYIGSWLHAWILRRDESSSDDCLRDGSRVSGLYRVIGNLSPAESPDPEADSQKPIKFLRRYSKYLTPRSGVFTADSWTIVAIWLRNTLLNLVILTLGLGAALMVPRMLSGGFDWASQYATPVPIAVSLALLLFAAVFCGINLSSFANSTRDVDSFVYTQTGVQWMIVLPLLASSFLLSAWLFQLPDPPGRAVYLVVGAVCSVLLFALSIIGKYYECWYDDFNRARRHSRWWLSLAWLGMFLASVITGAAAAGLLFLCSYAFLYWNQHATMWTVMTFGPPLIMALWGVVLTLHIGLLGRNMPDDRREWWSRTGAYLLFYAFGWLGLCLAGIWGPWFVAWLQISGYRILLDAGLSLTWVVSTAFGVLAGHSKKTGVDPATGGSTTGYLQIVATVAPYIFIAGLLVLLSFGIHMLSLDLRQPIPRWGYTHLVKVDPKVDVRVLYSAHVQSMKLDLHSNPPPTECDMAPAFDWVENRPASKPRAGTGSCRYWLYAKGKEPPNGHLQLPDPQLLLIFHPEYMRAFPSLDYAIAGLGCFALSFVLAWRVNVNEFSMHHFYRNRLIRCYLGASQKKRTPNPFTGLDHKDDRPLGDFTPKADSPLPPISMCGGPRQRYSGPYPIVNATLNLVQGDELAWQDRKGQAFVFTPEFSGYTASPTKPLNSDGDDGTVAMRYAYRPTRLYAYPAGGIHLGSAMAISGAAQSPNEGYNTSPANAFLMTVFNVRLGWWISNPRHRKTWKRPSPAWGLFYLFRELFADTNNKSPYLYLSDGGHFENLGIYELVHRRCRYIIVCDASHDGDFAFEDLGNAVRKCRTDFGADIQLGLAALTKNQQTGMSAAHCVVGKILYKDGRQGTIVYIKPTLTGDEPADVAEYAHAHPTFPHESTADQFFTEAQFESYRALGYHIVRNIFGEKNLIDVKL